MLLDEGQLGSNPSNDPDSHMLVSRVTEQAFLGFAFLIGVLIRHHAGQAMLVASWKGRTTLYFSPFAMESMFAFIDDVVDPREKNRKK